MEHEGEVYPQLERVTREMADGVAALAREANVPLTTNRVGSMFTWFFTPGPVTDYATAATSDTAAFGRFHRRMLEAGVWLPPSQFEAAFVSAAHGPVEVERVLDAARGALAG
jgi:glutamate-1-semialdehyde 2,1-aminomutase